MSSSSPETPRLPDASARVLIACLVACALLSLVFLGTREVTRTQEARVLETARQMLDAPDWRGWLVPQLNGEARLRKPPLCYWYTAASYKLLGVSEFAGRLPTLVLAWASVFITYLFGRDLMSRRAGLLAAAVLGSSYFFVRFSRSAETDTPAMLGTVLASWAIFRGATGRATWFHLAAVGIAISALSKGGPAIYPLLLVALLAFALPGRRVLRRFLFSGAPLVALALIAPWFVYILRDPAAAQVAQEVKVVTSGSNHFGLFYEYVPILLMAVLPWTGLFFVAVLADELRKQPAQAPRVIAGALGCVLLPLCVTLNVQPHYLLPAMPACALLVAWLLEIAISGVAGAGTLRALRWAFAGTSAIGLVASPAILVIAYLVHRHVGLLDLLAAATLSAASVVLFIGFRHRAAATQAAALAAAMLLVMPIVGGWWAPTMGDERPRAVADAVRDRFGTRPLITYGDDADIALGFYLRQTIPLARSELDVQAFLRRSPDGVIVYRRSRRVPAPLPGTLSKALEQVKGDSTLEFYELPQPSARS